MGKVEDVTRSKWISLIVFLIINFMQILFVVVLTLDETTLFIIGYDPSLANPIGSLGLFVAISLIQMVIVYFTSYRMLKGKDLTELYPSYAEDTEWRCKYSHTELVEWTKQLADLSDISFSKIYIIKSPIPNAFTFSLPFLGSIVVIHTNLLDLLSEDEVKSIIAHELGHIKKRDSLVSIFSQMPSYFVDIIYLYIYVRLGLGIANSILVQFDIIAGLARGLVLVGFYILSRAIMWLANIVVQKASRDAELLADNHAATITSPEVVINALIRLGQRIEAITTLIEEIRWLESLNPERMNPLNDVELKQMLLFYPLDGIDEENARANAPSVFLSTRLRNMRKVYGVELSDEQIQTAISPAIKILHEKREKILSERLEDESNLIDWKEADQDGDRRITESEMQDFINLLKTNPSKFMFSNETSANILTTGHPHFRQRIIFLVDTFNI